MTKIKNMKLNIADQSFLSHLCRYVGVGLISGSIVHVGTLGGSYTRYLVLIILGVLIFITGTILDAETKLDKHLLKYIFISVLVSIGIGMVSGGTQHYLDGPLYAAKLMPIGLLLAYLAFVYRDHRQLLSGKKILMAVVVCGLISGALYGVAHWVPELASHHEAGEEH